MEDPRLDFAVPERAERAAADALAAAEADKLAESSKATSRAVSESATENETDAMPPAAQIPQVISVSRLISRRRDTMTD